jgi:hypothetical protein
MKEKGFAQKVISKRIIIIIRKCAKQQEMIVEEKKKLSHLLIKIYGHLRF